MPGLGATDLADLEAKARAQLGLSRQLQVNRRIPPHPGKGGSPSYTLFHMLMQLDTKHNGEDMDASRRFLWRWDVCEIPYRTTGNKQRCQIVGIDPVNLVIFC